ncbi:Solute carrier family 35 member G1 [Holothuria leucospilota]|uniref:Solute carrier family 35 member G1 n=1 Tax=Holothuria leucospilota TaxID=206669 RepID=A0A9Q0YJ51_HOLLE|nr:Solute carrier family 35 member G1 [Holothuria leucospilota]
MESDRLNCLSQVTLGESLPGILFTLLSALSLSTEDLLLYVVIEDFHPFFIFVFNSNISFILCFLLVLTLRPRRPTTIKQFLLVILHGSLNCVNQISIAASIFAIGPGSAIALFFTVPIFTTVYSALFLRTRLQVKDVFFAICSTLGVALLTRYLTLIENQALNETFSVGFGVARAIAAAMAYAGALIVGRKLAHFETHSLVNVLSYSLQYSIVSIALCSAFNAWEAPKTLSSLAFLLGIGFPTFGGMLFAYLAVCYEKPTIVSIILTSEVIMTFIGQFAMFNFPFHWSVPVGSILIVFSCIGILLFENRKEDMEDGRSKEDENSPIVEKLPSN